MKTSAVVAAVCALGALALAGCRSQPTEERVRDVQRGALMHRTLRSYHVVYSANRGPVGYLKVYDVAEAGGPRYAWSYVYDKDLEEVGYVDQFGNAWRLHHYPPGAMPDPKVSIRYVGLPADSIQRNAMRMLGIDPSSDDVTFPAAREGDIGLAK